MDNEIKAIYKFRPHYFVNISKFILNNYKKKILFHSLNHPGGEIFAYLSNEILLYLNIDIITYPENLDGTDV
jgi:hypothetical protein